MMFLSPIDWQSVNSDALSVVYKGDFPPGRDIYCVLWTITDYTEKLNWRERRILSTAPLRSVTDGLYFFMFTDLKYYGTSVVSVIVEGDPPFHDDRAIRIFPARVSTAAAVDRRLTTHLPEDMHFPLAPVWTEHSNYHRSPSCYDGRIEMVDFDRMTEIYADAAEAPGTIRMAVCHPSETHDGSGALLQEFCGGLELLSQFGPTWTANETYYALLQQATVSLLSGLVIFEGRYRWGDSCPSPDFVDPESTLLPGSFRSEGQRGIVPMRRVTFRGDDVIPMVVANAGRGNYGHWLQNSVMAMFFVRDAIIAGKIVPVTPPLTNRQMRPLELIGITRDRILEINEPAIYLTKAIYPSFISTHVTSYPGSWGSNCYNAIRERSYRGYAGEPPRYIYFTRKGFSGGHNRGIENEDELIEMLRSIGFDIIAPHESTFDENLFLISRAKVIVSQIGAAMADIAFAPKGCVIIELVCDSYFHNVHLFMTHLFGQKIIRVASPVIEGTANTPEGFRFHVAVDKVRRAALGVMEA